jgi:hypothetical protein
MWLSTCRRSARSRRNGIHRPERPEDGISDGPEVNRRGLGVDPRPLFADLIDTFFADGSGSVERSDQLLGVGWLGRCRSMLSASTRSRPDRILWTGEPLPPLECVRVASHLARKPAPARPSQGTARWVVPPLGSVFRGVPQPGPLGRRRVAIAADHLLRANLEELRLAVRLTAQGSRPTR